MKIEKLNFDTSTIIDAVCVHKINQLCDAINELQEFCDVADKHLATLIKENNIHEKQIDELQMRIETLEQRVKALDDPTSPTITDPIEQPADPYAEQRKWIGKLCRMNSYDWGLVWDYKILERINENNPDSPFVATDGDRYKVCEPVKPDDDLIYKGE